MHSIGMANQIENLTKKSRNTLQLKTTISFEMKYFQLGWCHKLLNASHILVVFQRHNSIESSMHPAFLCLKNTTC